MWRPGFFRVLALASTMTGALSCALAPVALAGTQLNCWIQYQNAAGYGVESGTVSPESSFGTMSLSGTGKAPSQSCLTLPGSDLFLGFAQLGVGRTEIVRFANTGEGSFALTLSEESMSPNFSLPNGEGPFAVATGDTLDVPVRYDPLTTGVHVGTLVATSPCANVRLVGFGQRSPVACIAAVSELDFGDVPVGASREMEFHLFNYSGELALGDVFVSCDDFSLTSDMFYRVSWADSELVRVRFAPRTLGAQSCAVAVTGSCGDTIEIAGYGIAPPDTARARPWLFAASRPNEGVQRLVYDVLAAAHVEIIIYDVVGHELARFDEGVRAPRAVRSVVGRPPAPGRDLLRAHRGGAGQLHTAGSPAPLIPVLGLHPERRRALDIPDLHGVAVHLPERGHEPANMIAGFKPHGIGKLPLRVCDERDAVLDRRTRFRTPIRRTGPRYRAPLEARSTGMDRRLVGGEDRSDGLEDLGIAGLRGRSRGDEDAG